ncbi:MAG: bifunctional nuclease family protein [Chitinophagales bacterium]|nr:bifunctional nuclease family protein [Chitinophagales bacterium]MDW8273953.1 bifunctional nuclease family protein [Chitinophagales bacterium]
MRKVELEILALSHSLAHTHSYSVILGEIGGTRRLPIVIGGFEAQAIAVVLDNMHRPRPLTHDLIKAICDTFDISLEQVHINKLHEGVFYCNLICKQNGEIYEIDSRTSDALALAVRFGCPIYVDEDILNEAGIDSKAEEEAAQGESGGPLIQPPPTESTNYSGMTDEELSRQLSAAIEGEDYEKAARIRDEINRRKKK